MGVDDYLRFFVFIVVIITGFFLSSLNGLISDHHVVGKPGQELYFVQVRLKYVCRYLVGIVRWGKTSAIAMRFFDYNYSSVM